MRRPSNLGTVLAPIAAALLIVACAATDATAAVLDKDSFDLDWDDGEIIVIALDDRRTFDTAVLVAPDGTEVAAFSIERDRETNYGNDSGSGMDWGVGTGVGIGTGGSSGVGVGVGIGFPLGGGSEDPATIRYRTEAQIRVPDMAAYRAGWTGWVLRIHLPQDELWTERTIEMPAPEPPE